ncbi:hypothetical protein HDU91_005871 [Kappamyces sp. JEL0680]|nr:hypothetical protein HDU91_005871 [Kappamyces sp. JEL0680]
MANGPHKYGQLSYYREYLMHLWENKPAASVIETFATGYQDYLQAPLQPLMDNLHSTTYQVFESDPVKYNQYELAIHNAIIDRFRGNDKLVIMVVGAGRGPLVDRALKAAEAANQAVRVYAIEKNSNAIITFAHPTTDHQTKDQKGPDLEREGDSRSHRHALLDMSREVRYPSQ